MRNNTALLSILLVFALSLSGCSSLTSITRFPSEVDDKVVVYGRVLDHESKPVVGCDVVLVKRQLEFRRKVLKLLSVNIDTVDTLGEYVVATTDDTGDYSFTFDWLNANDIWLSFQAKGYVPQLVQANYLMVGRMFPVPVNTPVNQNIIMEKEW